MELTQPTPRTTLRLPDIWPLLLAGFCLLAAGGWVYVTSRPGTLIYALCHQRLGVTECTGLPEFVLYSLPDGLWCLASILMLHALLCGETLRRRLAITAVVPAIGAGSELMQGAGWLCGVFDPCDLICYSLPFIIYAALQLRRGSKLTNQS